MDVYIVQCRYLVSLIKARPNNHDDCFKYHGLLDLNYNVSCTHSFRLSPTKTLYMLWTCYLIIIFVITLDDTSSLQKCLGGTEANLNLSLNGAIIEQVKSSKLLGIHIEQDLDFDAQSDAYVNRYQRKLDFSSTLVHT